MPNDKETCPCYAIEDEINKDHPGCDWNNDEACDEWRRRVDDLPIRHVKPEEDYACCCPACGRSVCGWCV